MLCYKRGRPRKLTLKQERKLIARMKIYHENTPKVLSKNFGICVQTVNYIWRNRRK